MEAPIVVLEAVIWTWICASTNGDAFKYVVAAIVVLGLLDVLVHRKDQP